MTGSEDWSSRWHDEPPRRSIGPVGALALMVVCACAGILGAWGTIEWMDRSPNAPTAGAASASSSEALAIEIVEMEAYVDMLRDSVRELSEMEADALGRLQAAEEEVARESMSADQQQLLAERQRVAERIEAELATTTTARPPTTTLHPKVVSDAEAAVAAVVEQHRDSWPWVQATWDAAEVMFYERLPAPCQGAAGCVRGSEMWLTLDAVRSDDTVLHELGHVWNNVGLQTGYSEPGRPEWGLVQAVFYEHYAGCYSKRADAERLGEELLVDAMVLATDPSKAPLFGGYGYYEGDDITDFWGDGGFSGCLVDSGEPPEHLAEAIFASLYNCQADATTGGDGFVLMTSEWERMAQNLAVSVCEDLK